jgi:acetylornithine deacetylase/succinyl-diaminopimelate desuccinylase-like protein
MNGGEKLFIKLRSKSKELPKYSVVIENTNLFDINTIGDILVKHLGYRDFQVKFLEAQVKDNGRAVIFETNDIDEANNVYRIISQNNQDAECNAKLIISEKED